MKLLSKNIYWAVISAAAVAALVLLLLIIHGKTLRSSLESGQFEAGYLKAIEYLEDSISNVSEKLDNNRSENLSVPEQTVSETSHQQKKIELNKPIQPNGLILHGVYLNQSQSLAEINGKLVRIGDQVGIFTIKKIDPYSVTLSQEGEPDKTIFLKSIQKGDIQ